MTEIRMTGCWIQPNSNFPLDFSPSSYYDILSFIDSYILWWPNDKIMYELTFLLNEEAELKTLSKLVESFDGKLLSEKKWGKRELTYPIKKITAAEYYTWIISIDETQLGELRKKLNFNDKLIRFLLLKIDDEPQKKPLVKEAEKETKE
ncbi:MAG: ribosomal protein [Candidatus Parcubacteria bacterium]